MTLPNRESAYVPSAKLDGYLLSEVHPIGRAKALFLKNLGYDIKDSSTLERDLISIAHEGVLTDTITSEYGTKYVITGEISAPNGETVWLRTVWIIDRGIAQPRFVTAYPDRPRQGGTR